LAVAGLRLALDVECSMEKNHRLERNLSACGDPDPARKKCSLPKVIFMLDYVYKEVYK